MLDDFGDQRELVSKHHNVLFDNSEELLKSGKNVFEMSKNDILSNRSADELYFYEYLKNQMLHRLQEMKFYSDVDVMNTRRLIATSNDCISSIHILIRNYIHVNVYFRSSDYDGALPSDLEFLSTLPTTIINHLKTMKNSKYYPEVNDNTIEQLSNTPIKLNLSFGSLHRTNKLEKK